MFMDKLVSWEAVSSRLEKAKAIISEREREEENKRKEEKEKSTEGKTRPTVIFVDTD